VPGSLLDEHPAPLVGGGVLPGATTDIDALPWAQSTFGSWVGTVVSASAVQPSPVAVPSEPTSPTAGEAVPLMVTVT